MGASSLALQVIPPNESTDMTDISLAAPHSLEEVMGAMKDV